MNKPVYRRPESVLVVIYTESRDFLLMERRRPAGYWQSVTGSLEWGELPDAAARREVLEETGIVNGVLVNLQWAQTYEILPAFGKTYAPGVFINLEHAFSLRLPARTPIVLADKEHLQYCWLPAAEAIERVSSPTNRAVMEEFRS